MATARPATLITLVGLEAVFLRVTAGPIDAVDLAIATAIALAIDTSGSPRPRLASALAVFGSWTLFICPIAWHAVGPWGLLAALPGIGLAATSSAPRMCLLGPFFAGAWAGLPLSTFAAALGFGATWCAVQSRGPSPWLAMGVLGLLAVGPHGVFPRWDDRPDLVLVTVDTLRADAIGPPSTRPPTTATRAWSPAPWTLPSLATVLTGRMPEHHGAGRAETGFQALKGPRIADELRHAGYRTIAISAGNPFTTPTWGLQDGFDEVWHPWAPNAHPLPRGRSPHGHARPLFARLVRTRPTPDDAETLVTRTLARLDRPDGPRFVWLHLMDTHLPYADSPCRPDVLGRPAARQVLLADPWWSTAEGTACLRAAYTAAAARVHHALNRLVDGLDPTRTRLVITADHGESLGERGDLEHGHALHPELLEVPLWVWGHTLATQPTPRSVADIAPLLRAWAGITATPKFLPRTALPLSHLLYGDDQRGAVSTRLLYREWPREVIELHTPAAAAHAVGTPPTSVAGAIPPWPIETRTPREASDATRRQLRALGYIDGR